MIYIARTLVVYNSRIRQTGIFDIAFFCCCIAIIIIHLHLTVLVWIPSNRHTKNRTLDHRQQCQLKLLRTALARPANRSRLLFICIRHFNVATRFPRPRPTATSLQMLSIHNPPPTSTGPALLGQLYGIENNSNLYSKLVDGSGRDGWGDVE